MAILFTSEVKPQELNGTLILVSDNSSLVMKNYGDLRPATGDFIVYIHSSKSILWNGRLVGIHSLGKQIVVKPSKILAGMRFCFTGAAGYSRPIMWALVKNHGGEVDAGVTKKTTHLVMQDLKSNSTKAIKAKEYSVACITVNAFYNLINAK